MGVAAGPLENLATGEPLHARLSEVALGYQRMLTTDPHNAEALVGMGLVALASGQTAEAVLMARAGVEVAPHMGPAWVTLGQALKAEGQPDQAEAAYIQAIHLDGMDPLARMGLGELRLSQGRPADAVVEFGLAIERRPAMAAAHLGLGNARAFLGNYAEALADYERALALKPRQPEIEFAAGFALTRLGRHHEAELRYRRALHVRPDFAAAWLNLGCIQREMGKDILAQAALRRAVELCPKLTNAWINLGLVERDRGQSALAEEQLRRALALGPDKPDTLVAWAQFRAAENDLAGAWSWLRWALLRNPEHQEALNMQGIVLHKQKRFAEAVEVFAHAEALGHRAASSNRGNSLLDLGRTAEALEAHRMAFLHDPESPGAQYNLALTGLRRGEWPEGWRNYEARWRFREVHKSIRVFRQPRWHGEPLHGERVLLHAEQGLGDTIQFCRYAALVAARGGRPVLLVQCATVRLLLSLPAVRSAEVIMAKPGDLKKFDLECPLMSLPAVFGATIDTVPWSGAYLAAEPDEIHEKWLQFPSSGAGPRIGIAWAGNPRYKADAQRSTRLETLLPLLRTPGFEWIALQKDHAVEQIAALPRDVCVVDGSSQEKDLAETAALIATLDAVVTTDTFVAHLAGAMAKPVWMLLPFLADWRWMQDRETTPRYPTVRLLRQQTPGDWTGVVARAAEELQDFRQCRWRAAS